MNDSDRYRSVLRSAIKQINTPSFVLCCSSACNDKTHRRAHSDYYNDIILSINEVSRAIFLPLIIDSASIMYSVPRLSDFVSDKHDAGRYAFCERISNGKP